MKSAELCLLFVSLFFMSDGAKGSMGRMVWKAALMNSHPHSRSSRENSTATLTDSDKFPRAPQ
jgi:hypothetical protein